MTSKRASRTYPNRPIRPRGGRSEGVCHTPLPCRQEKAFNPSKKIGIHTYPASPMPARIGKSIPTAILFSSRFGRLRPPAKFAPSRFGHTPHPANFPGLGRGLDLLLSSFLPSREGRLRSPAKFSPSRFGYIPYPANFLGLGRGLDLLLPSFLPSREEKKNPSTFAAV